MFVFRYNIVLDQTKYFFLNHGLNSNLFNSLKLMDKIKANIDGTITDHTEGVADQNLEMNVN